MAARHAEAELIGTRQWNSCIGGGGPSVLVLVVWKPIWDEGRRLERGLRRAKQKLGSGAMASVLRRVNADVVGGQVG